MGIGPPMPQPPGPTEECCPTDGGGSGGGGRCPFCKEALEYLDNDEDEAEAAGEY